MYYIKKHHSFKIYIRDAKISYCIDDYISASSMRETKADSSNYRLKSFGNSNAKKIFLKKKEKSNI